MGRAVNEGQAFSGLHAMMSVLVLMSAAGCGGLADHRRGGEPSGMAAMGGGSARAPGECNPFMGNGCELPVGCDASISPQCRDQAAGSAGEPPNVDPCLENPFIIDCVPSQPPEPAPEPPPEPAVYDEISLPVPAAENVLAANCGQCHGPLPEFADSVQGGLGDIQDFEALRQAGYLIDCSAESSPIIQVMRSGSMPPPNSGLPRVTTPDIDVVASAIEVGCTSSEKSCAGDPSLPGCGLVLAERALERNCGVCHGARARATSTLPWVENMDYIDDMAKLISNTKVVPCQPEMSSVLVRARDGSMPPPGRDATMPPLSRLLGLNGFAFSPRDDAAVQSFIEGLCPGPASPDDTEQLRVEELLGTYCGDCHGQRAVELGQVQGGIDDIESVDASIRAGRLVPCFSEGSPIIQQLRDGNMPPPASAAARPSELEIQLIAEFVDRPCVRP